MHQNLNLGPPLPASAGNGVMNELIFILTTRCNQRCQFCCEPPSEPDMETQTAIEWLGAIQRAGVPWVDFSGGEPLLHHDVRTILAASSSLGLKNTLSTNGILVRRKVDEVFPFVDQWNISLHGSPEVHDKLVQRKRSHKTILEACRLLASQGATVHITYVVTAENILDVGPVMTSLAEAGVRKICFNYVFRRGHGKDYLAQYGLSRSTAVEYVANQIRAFPPADITFYHNMNLDGQCALVRPNGNVWGVPMSNGSDYEVVFSMAEIQEFARSYPYMNHHRKFTYPRLAPVAASSVEFDMTPAAHRDPADVTV